MPQLPQLPTPSGDGEPSDSNQSESGQSDAEASVGDPTLPAGEGGPLRTGAAIEDGSEGDQVGDQVGDQEGNPEGDQEGNQQGNQNADGSTGLEGAQLPSGTEQGDGSQNNDGWEISNELPVPEGGTVAGEEQDDGELAGLPDDGNGTLGGVIEDEELERTLGGLDGEILAERNSEIEKANDRAVASGLPDMTGEETDEVGGDATVSGGTATAPNEVRVQVEAGSTTPGNLPTVVRAAVDTPDARDEDVIARQLREAALAEKDPELRASLWEEYERYTGKKQ